MIEQLADLVQLVRAFCSAWVAVLVFGAFVWFASWVLIAAVAWSVLEGWL